MNGVSSVRHVTVDFFGNILEVTNMYDRYAKDTQDPALAESCVIRLRDGTWFSATTDDAPIYTVH